jgi:hypothetical protein
LAVKKTWILPAVAVLTALVAVWFLYARDGYARRLHAAPRKEWKDRAVSESAQLTGAPVRIEREVDSAKRALAEEKTYTDAWISDRGGATRPTVSFILMANGQWIAYASMCSKEDERIHDIFVGHGSDGKWYYSTYHFCVRMIALRTDPQPSSLAAFAERYFLREFDGRSDEALRATWPPKRR